MTRITAKMALEIAAHEGLAREAYKDSVNVWTWSIGITNATGHNVERYIDKPQPMRRCLEVYVWSLKKYADEVDRVFAGYHLTENEFAAAVSFHYNTGGIARASWVEKWKAGDIAGARKAFMNWSKPPEIIPRREAERDLFFTGKWSGDGKVTVYEVGRNYRPVWSSGKRVDVTGEMEQIIGANDRKRKALSPIASSPEGKGFWAMILKLFGGGRK